ncbi:MAG: hypothetical protein P8Q50_03945 [Octadecabacter sp.]|nr:hypothetical protein [Octadecabacter sp.]
MKTENETPLERADMFEATTNARTRDAIRNTHAKRGAVLRGLFRRK